MIQTESSTIKSENTRSGNGGAALIIAGAVILTTVVTLLLRSLEEQYHNAELQRITSAYRSGLNNNLNNTVSQAGVLQSFMQAVPGSSRREFEIFVNRTVSDFPEISAMAWVPRVSQSGMDGFMGTMKQELGQQYVRKFQMLMANRGPDDSRGPYHFLLFLAPESQHAQFLGVDITSLSGMPEIFAEVEACACARMVPDRLMRKLDEKSIGSYMLISPIYHSVAHGKPGQSRLRGFTASFFSISGTFVSNPLQSKRHSVMFKVWDISSGNSAVIYQSNTGQNMPVNLKETTGAAFLSEEVSIAGTTFRFEYFDISKDSILFVSSSFALILGLGFTVLLISFIRRNNHRGFCHSGMALKVKEKEKWHKHDP